MFQNYNDEALKTSRTVIEGNSHAISYFDIDEDNIIVSRQETNKVDRLSKIYSHHEFEAELEGQQAAELGLSPQSSNETIGNNYTTTEKDAMFAEDAGIEFPEGGLEAWKVVFGSFMGLTSVFGLENVSGVIESYIAENQLSEYKQSTIGWIFSINLFVMFLASVFSGTYFDRNGAKKPIAIGGLFIVAGLIATANATKMWHFVLSFGVCSGLGSGISVSAIVSPLAHYFSRKRGLVSSLATTGGSVGGVVFPIMLRKLYSEVGFSWALRCFALVHLGCFVICFFLIKERLPHHECNEPFGQKLKLYLTTFDLKGLQDQRFLLCCLGCVLAESLAFTVGTYYVSFATSHGLSLQDSYLLITLTNVGGIPGRWITGFYSDYIGRFNMMIITLFSCGLSCFIILVPFASNHNAVFYVFAVTWGFTTGSIFSLIPVCCGQISKTKDFGKRYGTMYSMVGFGVLIWIPISGTIIGSGNDWEYRNFIIFMGVTCFASSACYLASRAKSTGWTNFKAKF